MSLFQSREWWAAKPDGSEECDKGCLCVANIDNDSKKAEKIITGSFQGFLRIYYPRQSGYRIEDLMLETQLEGPILQIEAGKFTQAQNRLSLAILHPRKLVVYNVVGSPSNEPSYYELNKAYEHKLDRSAFNFTYGPFGGVYGKDYICVQSLDGQLSIYEQESYTFSRYLNNFLIPGPLCYVAKIDSFVTVNSAMEVECYKYQMLSSSSADKKEEKDDHGLTSSKKVQTDWSINLGEHVLDIFVARYSRSLAASQVDILVLGEQTLFTLKENGAIRLQKRLDYNPSSCHTYNISEEDVGGSNQNLIVGTHQHSLMVYRDTQLAWAARCGTAPVAVRVTAFGGIKGMIVTLNDQCHVQVSYLGTDPPLQGATAAENKELDYEAMDEEHRRLLKVIRAASTDSMAEPKEKITLRAQVPNGINTGPDAAIVSEGDDDPDLARDEHGKPISCTVKLFVSYNGKEDIENISLSFDVPPAFKLAERSKLIPTIKANPRTPEVHTLRFRVSKTVVPSSLDVTAVAVYTTQKGEPRTAQCKFQLPLLLACRVVAPLKNCQYMFTLDTNRSPPALNELFPDIMDPAMAANQEIKRAAANVMTAVYYAQGVDVTILVSKKAGRYRLQSANFEALSLISEQLSERLTAFYAKEGATDEKGQAKEEFQIGFKELLPLHDYFVLIDKHFTQRQRMVKLRENLAQGAHQFRVIQKRLLVRFKEKNPTPLNQLDTVMNETYNKIIDTANELEKVMTELGVLANQVSCSTHLMLLLIRFKYELDKKNAEALQSYLSPQVQDNLEQGWEEATFSALTHLLRSALAKNARDGTISTGPVEKLDDTSKLKRHIQIVCDRLGKGHRLVKKPEKPEPAKKGAKSNGNSKTTGPDESDSGPLTDRKEVQPTSGKT